ncbi:MAG: sigma-70 family RNA polymerase sigma factor [Lentimicrobium sp.]|jgi:RNA polymerase sigma-70 factor (ECF subfamily)|nr:sigma-70 family RNA polymerase sigma factor [Lentimicrobium sp.]
MQYSDEELIKQILAGETKLYELLIRRYNPYLYRIGRSQNYSHDDTQDLMQDTYVDAYTNLSGFEGRSTFKTWIVKIMLNNCYRKRQKWGFKHIISSIISEKSIPTFFNGQRWDPNKTVMNEELNSIIENALLRIPVNYRMVFTLREVNGLSVKETADTLNISEANVKVRLNRAKAMLREEVEKSYSAEEIFEFNLIYCDAMVENVMKRIKELAR